MSWSQAWILAWRFNKFGGFFSASQPCLDTELAHMRHSRREAVSFLRQSHMQANSMRIISLLNSDTYFRQFLYHKRSVSVRADVQDRSESTRRDLAIPSRCRTNLVAAAIRFVAVAHRWLPRLRFSSIVQLAKTRRTAVPSSLRVCLGRKVE